MSIIKGASDSKQDLPSSVRVVVSVRDSSHVVVRAGSGSTMVTLLSGSKRPVPGDAVLVHETPSGLVGVLLTPVGVSSFNFLMAEDDVLSVGPKGIVRLPYNAMLTGFYLYSDLTGSTSVDVKRAASADYAGWVDTTWTSIVGATLPAIASGESFEDAALADWDTLLPDDPDSGLPHNRLALLAGDVLLFEVASATTITALTCALQFRRLS